MSESSTSSNSSTSDKKIPKKVLLKEDISEFFNSLSTAMEEQFEILKKEVQEIRSMLESLKNSPHPQTIFVTGTIIFLFFFFFLFSIFQFSLLFSLQEMVVTAGALGLGTNVVNHRIVVENHFPAFDVHWLPVIFIGQSLLCPSRPLCC